MFWSHQQEFISMCLFMLSYLFLTIFSWLFLRKKFFFSTFLEYPEHNNKTRWSPKKWFIVEFKRSVWHDKLGLELDPFTIVTWIMFTFYNWVFSMCVTEIGFIYLGTTVLNHIMLGEWNEWWWDFTVCLLILVILSILP